MTNREPGFYWVQGCGDNKWAPAEWDGAVWFQLADEISRNEKWFDTIGDRIMLPEAYV